jgi:hypothetical protein
MIKNLISSLVLSFLLINNITSQVEPLKLKFEFNQFEIEVQYNSFGKEQSISYYNLRPRIINVPDTLFFFFTMYDKNNNISEILVSYTIRLETDSEITLEQPLHKIITKKQKDDMCYWIERLKFNKQVRIINR